VPHLTVLNGPNHGRLFPLKEGQIYRIGRDPGLDLCIDDAKASRVHVELELKAGQWQVRDLRSKNGLLVNAIKTTDKNLVEGDQIQIGETRLAFSFKDAPKGVMYRQDSMLAERMPVGAVPALGSTGAAKGEAEGFETIELHGPLPILRLEGAGAMGGQEALAPTVAMRETAAGLERANRCLRALYSIARAVAESTASSQLLTVLASRLRVALEADRVTPLILEEANRWRIADIDPTTLDSTVGKRTPTLSRVPVSRTIVDYAMRSRRSVLTAPRSDARFGGAPSVGEQGITSALCVPVLVGDRMLGLIYADRLGGQDFDREDQELLTAACLLAAPALDGLRRLEDALQRKERLLQELKGQSNILGECEPIKQVFAFIERAAPTEAVVLVLGESGTGKELVARAIHYNSARRENPLVIVNCAALSESLIESELFGHAKGAFTGATQDRMGRFEMAHEGTIFLDEIGELSPGCQTKLLRVIEQGELSRVGESRVRKVNVRLIAATNRDLAAEAKSGRFREDLYYRLNVLGIKLPALRERGTDIRLLSEHYLHDAGTRSGRQRLTFSEEAAAALLKYAFPGNVRELRNLAERLAVLCPGETVGLRDLPKEIQAQAPAVIPGAESKEPEVVPVPEAPPPVSASLQLADIEKDHILRVLTQCKGNKKQAAETLGIDRSTLYAKLRAYGIVSQG